MFAIRSTSQFLPRESFHPLCPYRCPRSIRFSRTTLFPTLTSSNGPIRAAGSDEKKKAPARLAQVQDLLSAAKERAKQGANQPIPQITLEHVTVNFARSGGPGGQNVNKVNTKVDMRFKVEDAYWLSERVREKISQMEKNRINKDGELVISSTRTRTQKGNIEDALEKLQAIIDAASYVPPPPSEDQVKRIQKLAAIGEKKRLDKKKEHSQKKAMRRSRDSWD